MTSRPRRRRGPPPAGRTLRRGAYRQRPEDVPPMSTDAWNDPLPMPRGQSTREVFARPSRDEADFERPQRPQPSTRRPIVVPAVQDPAIRDRGQPKVAEHRPLQRDSHRPRPGRQHRRRRCAEPPSAAPGEALPQAFQQLDADRNAENAQGKAAAVQVASGSALARRHANGERRHGLRIRSNHIRRRGPEEGGRRHGKGPGCAGKGSGGAQ